MELKDKIISTGAYYVAQQVALNIQELSEHEFSDDELDFLEDKGIEYIEQIMKEEYKPFIDLTEEEVQAVKNGLKWYEPYGLVNDWSLGICDYSYDKIMLDYIDEKERKLPEYELFSRLYLTVLKIKVDNDMEVSYNEPTKKEGVGMNKEKEQLENVETILNLHVEVSFLVNKLKQSYTDLKLLDKVNNTDVASKLPSLEDVFPHGLGKVFYEDIITDLSALSQDLADMEKPLSASDVRLLEELTEINRGRVSEGYGDYVASFSYFGREIVDVYMDEDMREEVYPLGYYGRGNVVDMIEQFKQWKSKR